MRMPDEVRPGIPLRSHADNGRLSEFRPFVLGASAAGIADPPMDEIFERFRGNLSKPATLGDALKTFLKRSGLSRRMRWRGIEAVWQDVVGAEMAGHTRVLRLARGVLVIETDSAPLMQELSSFYKSSLLEAIRGQARGNQITDIVFRLGEFS